MFFAAPQAAVAASLLFSALFPAVWNADQWHFGFAFASALRDRAGHEAASVLRPGTKRRSACPRDPKVSTHVATPASPDLAMFIIHCHSL